MMFLMMLRFQNHQNVDLRMMKSSQLLMMVITTILVLVTQSDLCHDDDGSR